MECTIKTEPDNITEIEFMVPTHTIVRTETKQLISDTRTIEETPTEEVNQPKNKKIWTTQENKKLMSLYNSLIGEVGNKFPYLKDMWEEIAAYFPNKTTQQCMNRHSTMLRKTRRRLRKVYLSENSNNVMKLGSKLNEDNLKVVGVVEALPTTSKGVHYWTDSETQKLVDLYNNFITQVGRNKRFRRKRDIYKEIAKYFPNKGPKTCQYRLNRLLYKPQNDMIKFIQNNSSQVLRKSIKSKIKNNFNSTLRICNVQTLDGDELKNDSDTETCSFEEEEENITELENTEDISEEEFIQITDEGVTRNDKNDGNFKEESIINVQDNEDLNMEPCTNITQTQPDDVFDVTDEDATQNDINMDDCIIKEESIINVQDNEVLNMKKMDKVFEIVEENQNTFDLENCDQTIESANDVLTSNVKNVQELSWEKKNNSNNNDLNTKDKTIQETLWEIATKKEEAKERRHKEKLQAIKELAIILNKIYHKIDK